MDTELIVVIISAGATIAASAGLWSWIQKKADVRDEATKLLMGMAHDRIMHLSMTYYNRGSISKDEYENLHKYIYEPYTKLGGNGSAKRMMAEVDKLPTQKVDFSEINRPVKATMVDGLRNGEKRIVEADDDGR